MLSKIPDSTGCSILAVTESVHWKAPALWLSCQMTLWMR